MDFFDTELIINRLKETQFEFEIVEGAAEYSAVSGLSGFRHGSLYVVLVRERNPAGDGPQPRAKAAAVTTFGVIAAVRNYRGGTAAEALKNARPIIGRMRKAILGWAPPGCNSPCIWIQGDVMESDKSTLLWADVFSTTHVLG